MILLDEVDYRNILEGLVDLLRYVFMFITLTMASIFYRPSIC